MAVGVPRRHRDRRRRTRRRVPRRSTRPVRPGADPPRALDDDLARVQRLGRSVAVHRRHARLVRTPAREGLPRQARADRPDDAARTRPGGDGIPPLGAPARPLGVVRRGRMVHLRTDLHPLGRDATVTASTSRSRRTSRSTRRSSRARGSSSASATTSTGRGACATRSTRSWGAAATRRSCRGNTSFWQVRFDPGTEG